MNSKCRPIGRAASLATLIGVLGFGGNARAAQNPFEYQPNLPVILLEAKEEIPAETKAPCRLQIIYPAGSEGGTTNRLAGLVKLHGGVSKAYAKKSFGLTIAKPAALLGMREGANWVLNAAYIDRSLMRHKLAYDLFRSAGSANAPRFAVASRFVEVHLNGNYHGVYLLMERVDRQLLQLRPYNSNDLIHACIYKAVDHAANFSQSGHGGYEQREPDALTTPYWQPLDRFNRFVSGSTDDGFFNETNGIAMRLDLDNAIDFHLLVLLTSNTDGITKNFILARDGQSTGPIKHRFFFAPWDYDATFGRNWDARRVPASVWLSNRLFERLLANAAYREKFGRRWNDLRKDRFSPATVQGMIDANARTLGVAAQRNAVRWPGRTGPYPDRLTFEQDLQEMKSWIAERVKWLDEEIARQARQPAR